RGDRVEHDSDALCELIQERDVNLGKLLEGSELHYSLNFALEQNGQNNDSHRRARAQAGPDPDVVFRDVAHQNTLFLAGALAYQSLTETEVGGSLIPFVEGVTGHELQS